MRLRDSFCMSKTYRDFSIFKTAAVAMMDRFKLIFLTAAHFRDTFSVSVPNFVEIGHTVSDT